MLLRSNMTILFIISLLSTFALALWAAYTLGEVHGAKRILTSLSNMQEDLSKIINAESPKIEFSSTGDELVAPKRKAGRPRKIA